MKYIKCLLLVLFLLTPLGALAEESGTLANLKVATGKDSVSTTCCDISRIIFQVNITGTATVILRCAVVGTHHTDLATKTASGTEETTLACANIESNVTSYTSGTVTVEYKVIH